MKLALVLPLCGALRAQAPPTRNNINLRTSTLENPAARVEVPDDGSPMRPRIFTAWDENKARLKSAFGFSDDHLAQYDAVSDDDLADAYETMQLCRQFENARAQSHMQGSIRGFMHLDNGQETIPALIADQLTKDDIKYSYYREHTHAAAWRAAREGHGGALRQDGGTCRGTGGSMHVYDVDTHFQGGWALAKADGGDDDRLTVVFCGEGGSQNGRLAEVLNVAAKESLPLLILCIDNGRAINTFTPDVAQNSEVWRAGEHYGVPGAKVDGQNLEDVLKTGRAVIDHVRSTSSPAILQVHTYRLQGHSPADPEHERGRKAEKTWARAEADPLKIFEALGVLPEDVLSDRKAKASQVVKDAVAFAKASPPPPRELAKELEYPDKPDTDYNAKPAPVDGAAITARSVPAGNLADCEARIKMLQDAAKGDGINIGDALNLAILEEMVRDPMTTIHAEDLQAGSSYDIPKLTQQTFGALRAADEIIDEGHFLGKALGEGMNGYRPIVELMNANFGIYGMAELSSAGNTYATTGGQFKMPMTVVGAGGTAPNQALGAEHSQPFHAYAMIRDDGPGILFTPVKLMKDAKVPCDVGTCMPLNKAALVYAADPAAVANGDAVTVLTYLHGVREAVNAIPDINANGNDIDLIELRSLKPIDMDTIAASLSKTHKLCILDESTLSGGVGASISARVSEELYDELDAPVKRLCMDDAPVPSRPPWRRRSQARADLVSRSRVDYQV
ncbi:pyruvate dehydrogenase [Aureococcus anophagefferens]|nr:pyruvate dehydrogenase [Aureococcus anophagefferens]